jgi:hypothetical protein
MPKTYEPIATTTLGSAATDITFTSIPATYTDLILVSMVRTTRNTGSTSAVYLRLNGDTGSNYSQTFLFGNGSTAGSSRESNQTRVYTADISADGTGSPSYAGFATLIININNYSNTTTNKTTLARVSSEVGLVEGVVGLYRSTSAVSSLRLYNDSTWSFVANSTFTLYGIKAA